MQFADIAVLALKALSERVIILLAMVMSFGLFCWALSIGTYLGLGVASAFTLFVFLPVLYRGSNGNATQPTTDDGAD